MGWTGTHATEYRNGKVDRKAQLEKDWPDGYEVLKSSMVGSIYYGAVKHGDEVFAVIARTIVDNSDWFNFTYKMMDESMMPYYFDCPKSILKLLTPTDNENALEWRERCNTRPKKLGSLPVGTTIRFASPYDTRSGKKVGDIVTLTKSARNRFMDVRTGRTRTTTHWTDGHYRWTSRMIPSNYEIIKEE